MSSYKKYISVRRFILTDNIKLHKIYKYKYINNQDDDEESIKKTLLPKTIGLKHIILSEPKPHNVKPTYHHYTKNKERKINEKI